MDTVSKEMQNFLIFWFIGVCVCVCVKTSEGTVFMCQLCRSIRMDGDTMVTGSDDWTARVWSVSRGTCDAVLACHAGPLLCVEYSASDKGIITGWL